MQAVDILETHPCRLYTPFFRILERWAVAIDLRRFHDDLAGIGIHIEEIIAVRSYLAAVLHYRITLRV